MSVRTFRQQENCPAQKLFFIFSPTIWYCRAEAGSDRIVAKKCGPKKGAEAGTVCAQFEGAAGAAEPQGEGEGGAGTTESGPEKNHGDGKSGGVREQLARRWRCSQAKCGGAEARRGRRRGEEGVVWILVWVGFFWSRIGRAFGVVRSCSVCREESQKFLARRVAVCFAHRRQFFLYVFGENFLWRDFCNRQRAFCRNW